MASERRLFHVMVDPMLWLLYRCACHHPSTTPGTVSAAGPPREGMLSRIPRSAYHSMEAARAERPAPQSAVRRELVASWMSQKLSPPTPFISGYTTAMV